jgi:hypothetical protein
MASHAMPLRPKSSWLRSRQRMTVLTNWRTFFAIMFVKIQLRLERTLLVRFVKDLLGARGRGERPDRNARREGGL